MITFVRNVAELIAKIEAGNLSGPQDLQTLQKLISVHDHALSGPPEALEIACNDLREHWLHSVAWCSDLSRELEKILILFEEM
jgi:hypothetical protein